MKLMTAYLAHLQFAKADETNYQQLNGADQAHHLWGKEGPLLEREKEKEGEYYEHGHE